MLTFRNWTLVLCAWLLLLAVCALLLPAGTLAQLFSERGPLEFVTAFCWLGAAVLALVRGWRPGLAALSIFLLCLTFADLEGGLLYTYLNFDLARALHQIPRIHYWPPGRDLGAGLLLILLLLAVLVGIWSTLRFLFAAGGLQQACGQALVLAGVLILCSQAVDLLPQLLPAASAGRRYLGALAMTLEEGLELAGAAFALLSLLTHPGSGGYLDPR